ncbi:hypothetical protein [Streptomyces sp. NPDC059455]|uniref:hypothetical protein n=1 Tax=Streptomyces sp. NPDC059455 TaxID=3346837 RepID=UPI0036D14DA4
MMMEVSDASSQTNRFRMPSSLITAVSRHLDHDAGSIPDDPDRLLELADVLDMLPDPRRRQGRRYRLGRPAPARLTGWTNTAHPSD